MWRRVSRENDDVKNVSVNEKKVSERASSMMKGSKPECIMLKTSDLRWSWRESWWRLATMTEHTRKPVEHSLTTVSIDVVMGSVSP